MYKRDRCRVEVVAAMTMVVGGLEIISKKRKAVLE
jgi:hypothetical protein